MLPGRILIVDDISMNRAVLSRALAEQGHQTATAENGRQALDMLRAKQEDGMPGFDVVLLDILMPEMDGFETLQHLKADKALRDLPVIVISALDEMDSVVRCIELGAEDYMPKPFDGTLLRARIDASLEKKRLRDKEQLYLRGLERELEIGREIQASFLPLELPELPGWEIAARFQPAREVAGDFYDAFSLNAQLVGLIVADVCDKGVGAALFMALFRTLFRALAIRNFAEATPDTCAQHLHDTIVQTNNYITRTHSQANMFATVFFGVLAPDTGKLTYVNAGQEPPLVLNRSGGSTQLMPTGKVVGLFADLTFGAETIQLARGDTLLAYTDGIADAEDSEHNQFTRERLAKLVVPPAESATQLLDRIEHTLRAHIAGANPFDDITMMAVRWLDAPP